MSKNKPDMMMMRFKSLFGGNPRLLHIGYLALVFMGTCAVATQAVAQFDPAKVKAEPAAVAARFPNPDVSYQTPGFKAGRSDFASHEEVIAFLKELGTKHQQMSLELARKSQQGREIPIVILASRDGFQKANPTVMILGQQHGNEPAGGEAALALIEQLMGRDRNLLEQVNVVVLPRANPDGAQNFVRATANGLDVNRDHLLLQTPEGQAIAEVALRFRPQVVMDLHEFTVGDRWLDKFAAYAKYDALLQASTVGNMDASVADIALRDFVGAARNALESQQLNTFWYHTSSTDPRDKVVSMGGVQPDTGRNVFGLRHAVSLLIETRGVGLGRAHFARRVHSHVLASLAVIRTAAAQGQGLVKAVEMADKATADKACQGNLVVRAMASPSTEALQFVDAATGADRTETVDWRSALQLQVVASRSRPCGYWIGPDQTDAVSKLQALGVQVIQLTHDRQALVESYLVLTEKGGQRIDARGTIAARKPTREVTVALDKSKVTLPSGGWFVGMNQALGSIIAAALEPDSQNSYVANHVMDLNSKSLMRVMELMD